MTGTKYTYLEVSTNLVCVFEKDCNRIGNKSDRRWSNSVNRATWEYGIQIQTARDRSCQYTWQGRPYMYTLNEMEAHRRVICVHFPVGSVHRVDTGVQTGYTSVQFRTPPGGAASVQNHAFVHWVNDYDDLDVKNRHVPNNSHTMMISNSSSAKFEPFSEGIVSSWHLKRPMKC